MSNATMPVRTAVIAGKAHNKRKPQPVWEIAESYPLQGKWREYDYLTLPENGRRIEFVDGRLEFLSMPTLSHERISKRLFLALDAFVESATLGEVSFSGSKVKLREGEIRLPDILLILNDRLQKHNDDYYFGVDLVMEVVSPSSQDRKRDLVDKRDSYALAEVPEYWIVDPKLEQITVLKLSGNTYAVHGEFKKGQTATSALLAGFEVDVTEALAGRQ